MESFDRGHLLFGLVFTWLAGMGRYWDNPRAGWLQHLGVGSLVYVLVLSALLWLILRPVVGRQLSYAKLLTFVSLTSPPAILYAIPVERFTDLPTAQGLNIGFLAVVATWRVALLLFYVIRGLQLRIGEAVVVTLLPLTLIVSALTALNLQHVVFRIMGGLAEEERTAHDGAYATVVMLTILSVYAFVPLLFCYGFVVLRRWRERR